MGGGVESGIRFATKPHVPTTMASGHGTPPWHHPTAPTRGAATFWGAPQPHGDKLNQRSKRVFDWRWASRGRERVVIVAKGEREQGEREENGRCLEGGSPSAASDARSTKEDLQGKECDHSPCRKPRGMEVSWVALGLFDYLLNRSAESYETRSTYSKR